MKLITDIYEEYQIPRPLQEHQLRVAGVASILCDNSTVNIDSDSVIKACLLHDMGNIIKFDFSKEQPEGAELDDLDYWKGIQKKFIETYGREHHEATATIAREIGVSEEMVSFIDAVGYDNVCNHTQEHSLELKICAYSDVRVKPNGVVPLNERLRDFHKRYENRKTDVYSQQDQLKKDECFRELENQIFQDQNITPEYITNERVNEKLVALRRVVF
jgi:putative nucleotidyltransferase with HDIG domain